MREMKRRVLGRARGRGSGAIEQLKGPLSRVRTMTLCDHRGYFKQPAENLFEVSKIAKFR